MSGEPCSYIACTSIHATDHVERESLNFVCRILGQAKIQLNAVGVPIIAIYTIRPSLFVSDEISEGFNDLNSLAIFIAFFQGYMICESPAWHLMSALSKPLLEYFSRLKVNGKSVIHIELVVILPAPIVPQVRLQSGVSAVFSCSPSFQSNRKIIAVRSRLA